MMNQKTDKYEEREEISGAYAGAGKKIVNGQNHISGEIDNSFSMAVLSAFTTIALITTLIVLVSLVSYDRVLVENAAFSPQRPVYLSRLTKPVQQPVHIRIKFSDNATETNFITVKREVINE